MSKPKKKTVMPSLRFPEFRDAGPWEVKKLGEVLTFQTGFPFSSKYFNEAGCGLRLIRNADLKSSDRMVFYSGSYDQTFIVDDGDILVGMDGDFSPSVWRNGKALLNQRVGRVFAKDGNSLAFLHYSLFIALKVIEQSTAQTTVKHLSHTTVEKTKWPIPVFREQQKIADCLSSLDDLIRAEEGQLAALKDHKKGLMQQLFPVEGETTPRLRFPEFRDAGPWEVKRLGKVCKITNGSSNAQDHEHDGAYPLFDRSEVVKKSNKFLFDCEAVIIPGEGVKFVPKYYIGKFDLHQRAYALMGFYGSGLFIYYQMDALKNELANKAVMSTVLSLRLPILEGFRVTFPSIEEQQKIADCLSLLDDLIRAQGEKIEALKQHKKGLMQQLFPREAAQ